MMRNRWFDPVEQRLHHAMPPVSLFLSLGDKRFWLVKHFKSPNLNRSGSSKDRKTAALTSLGRESAFCCQRWLALALLRLTRFSELSGWTRTNNAFRQTWPKKFSILFPTLKRGKSAELHTKFEARKTTVASLNSLLYANSCNSFINSLSGRTTGLGAGREG